MFKTLQESLSLGISKNRSHEFERGKIFTVIRKRYDTEN